MIPVGLFELPACRFGLRLACMSSLQDRKMSLIVLSAGVLGVLCCIGPVVGLCGGLYVLFPTETPDPQEITIRNAVARELGVEPDWAEISQYFGSTYIPLGMKRLEVHERLARIGTFSITREENYHLDWMEKDISSELVEFDNPYLHNKLGRWLYEYDQHTGQLVGVQVLYSTGETARILPPWE